MSRHGARVMRPALSQSWLMRPASDSWLMRPAHASGSWLMRPASWLMRPASWLMRPASWLMRHASDSYHASDSCVMRHASCVRLLSCDRRPASWLMRPYSVAVHSVTAARAGHDDNETAAFFHVLMPLDLRLLSCTA